MAKASVRILNEYRLIYLPGHPKAMHNENWDGYVYEHIEVVERYLDRQLLEDEVVHHLDFNRGNNRIENLLVLNNGQHSKLHAWLDRGAPIIEKDRPHWKYSDKPKLDSPTYCNICGKTLQEKQHKTCSIECSAQTRHKVNRPSKEQLNIDLSQMSYVRVGLKYGVSDNAVRKWIKKLSA